ncbi:hypothetical protein [Enterobacter phage vB_ExiM_F5M1E]|nr:hypothetical protein [Enterobacter phage vB_ExiM_F1M1E]UNA03230.1 hypothetical protein [Enterobacter phage vB_ExiM_F2M1E]UNA03550.1 hypothetical protein [Enterobacter phage vB_ExiM_F4M1E]UNA03871.1 hypothetical protein [Enterobacter phage vB_ExiM_F5M1E]UNA04191.1 hypothetical protein [Pantoea phage vB_PdiM_F5M2A]
MTENCTRQAGKYYSIRDLQLDDFRVASIWA